MNQPLNSADATSGDGHATLDELYQDAPCGMFSMLPDGTIVRANRTLLRWLGYDSDTVIGRRRFQSLLSPGDRIFYETHYAPLLMMQSGVREIAVDLLRADGQRLPVLLSATARAGPGGIADVVHTAVFAAADRREYERELLRARQAAEASEARAQALAETLQASFLPPDLPEIPGVQIGARYRPAGRGDEVGGDFYDVFQTGERRWAVVLGDVCGKGAHAAVVTSLARHTVRAAAIRGAGPRGVLLALNAALLSHRTERFCTAVYARLSLSGEDGLRVTVSVAGHPPPLLADRQRVTEFGEPGTMLGVIDNPTLHERSLTLRHGAGIAFYTDGLTEARRGDDFFGVERLRRSFLEEYDGSAQRTVERVSRRVLDFQQGLPRDDMAVVLLRAQ